jgi:hypothetical protein
MSESCDGRADINGVQAAAKVGQRMPGADIAPVPHYQDTSICGCQPEISICPRYSEYKRFCRRSFCPAWSLDILTHLESVVTVTRAFNPAVASKARRTGHSDRLWADEGFRMFASPGDSNPRYRRLRWLSAPYNELAWEAPPLRRDGMGPLI